MEASHCKENITTEPFYYTKNILMGKDIKKFITTDRNRKITFRKYRENEWSHIYFHDLPQDRKSSWRIVNDNADNGGLAFGIATKRINWYDFKKMRGSTEYSDENPFYGISPMSDLKMTKERPMNMGEFAVHIIDNYRQNELWQMTYNPFDSTFEISGDRVNGLIKKKV